MCVLNKHAEMDYVLNICFIKSSIIFHIKKKSENIYIPTLHYIALHWYINFIISDHTEYPLLPTSQYSHIIFVCTFQYSFGVYVTSCRGQSNIVMLYSSMCLYCILPSIAAVHHHWQLRLAVWHSVTNNLL